MRLGHDVDVDERSVSADEVHAVLPQRRDAQLNLLHHLGLRPTGLLQQQIPLVVIGEQVCRPVYQPADLFAGQPGQLLARIRGERQPQRPALLGVAEHRLGVVGTDDHKIGCTRARNDVGQLDVTGLRHSSRVERGDLGHVLVCGADKPGRVGRLRDEHAVTVHTVAGEPLPILIEIRANRPHQHRAAAQHAHGESHVSRDTSAMHDEVVNEETQRHLLQMVGEELLGEPTRKTHQMIGCDRSGHRNGHRSLPFIFQSRPSGSQPPCSRRIAWRTPFTLLSSPPTIPGRPRAHPPRPRGPPHRLR